MIKILKNEGLPILEVEIGEKITEQDYEELRPALERKVEKHGEINILIRLQAIPDVSAGAVIEDLKLAVKNYSDISKIAVLGNDEKLGNLSKLDKLFPGMEMKTFTNSEVDEAWQWLKS